MERNDLLPNDLLEDILTRLSVKHLRRLRCVCKLWCALIDDLGFIMKHQQVQYETWRAEGDVPLFLCDMGAVPGDLVRLYLLSKKNGDIVLNLTPDIERDTGVISSTGPFYKAHCFGVVNGIICLESNYELHLWNPAIRDFKIVAYPTLPERACVDILGFGFDPVSNDFKIVLLIRGSERPIENPRTVTIYEMYSLSKNSWKKLREPSTDVCMNLSFTYAYLSGFYYWTGYLALEHHQGFPYYVIASFDFTREHFEVFHPPERAVDVMAESDRSEFCIGLYMESLALIISRNKLGETACSIDIWVVKKFQDNSGVPLLWQCLFTINQIPSLNGTGNIGFQTLRMDGDLVLLIQTGGDGEEECSLYDPSTGQFKNLGIASSCCFRYVESLFPLSKSGCTNSCPLKLF